MCSFANITFGGIRVAAKDSSLLVFIGIASILFSFTVIQLLIDLLAILVFLLI